VARDGTAIPATLVLSRHSSARNTLVRAYGAYGQSLPTAFKYEDVPLLLRGWNIVFLHVRGGGELGSAWHDQGRRLLKAASSNDVIDGVLWLRTGHLKDRVNCIVLEAYSAGALSVATAASDAVLAGAVPNSPSAPMISAMLLQYAFVDPLSAMMDASLSLTVHERDEWGDPIADEAAKSLLQNISPYHRVLKGQLPVCPVLLMNSAIDVRVQPWQQAKFVQAIRSSMRQSNQPKRKHLGDQTRNALPPVLMLTDFCNGHMGPDDPVLQAENSAANLAWMLFAVGDI
jgi:protease II